MICIHIHTQDTNNNAKQMQAAEITHMLHNLSCAYIATFASNLVTAVEHHTKPYQFVEKIQHAV